MGKPDRAAVIATAPRVAREAFEELGFERDICILSCNVLRELFRLYGINAKPVPVRAVAANQEAWDAAEGDPKVLLTSEARLPEGAWTAGVGFGPPEDGYWQGHLILTTRNPDCVIDPTLDQASRPDKGLPLEPFIHQVDRATVQAFERGEGGLLLEEEETGIRILYARILGAPPMTEEESVAREWPGLRRRYAETLKERVDARLKEER